jgi:hypothetical protein
MAQVSFDLERDIDVAKTDIVESFSNGPIPNSSPLPTTPPVGKVVQIGEKLLRPRDFDCYQGLDNPGRPKFLGKLIDSMGESLVDNEEKYKEFVSSCESVTKNSEMFDALNLCCTLRYTKPLGKKMHEDTSSSDCSSTMVYAFMFYAAMQQAGSGSFQATEIANETMSYYELDKFCRDFDIVPKLLTKYEVKGIWQDFIQIYVQTTGGTPPQALTFDQFKDMFVRMALFAYNKVGMKRMILAVTGFFPSPSELISSLCEHCHFHDFPYVQSRIRSVGRETQGALNFRSSDDNNNRARAEIRIDLRAKYLARVSAKENKDKEEKERKRQEKLFGAQNDSETDAKGKPKTVQYGMWSATSGKKFKQGGGLFNFSKKGKQKSNNLPDIISQMLDNDDPSVSRENSHVGSKSGESSLAESSVHSGVGSNSVASENEDNLMTYDKATALAKMRGTRIDMIASQYSKDLLEVLTKYCRTDPPPEKAGVIESGGAFMDAGHLPPNTQCSLLVTVTNLTLDILQLDISAEGFEDPETRVIINPNPVISGIQRQGNVTFSIPNRTSSQLAYINVAAVSSSGLHHNLRCPVFYRADTSCVNRAILTSKTLPKLCEVYLGRPFSPSKTFDKKKPEDEVLWVRPVSASALRRSVHEMRPSSSRAVSSRTQKSGTMTTTGRRPVSSGLDK